MCLKSGAGEPGQGTCILIGGGICGILTAASLSPTFHKIIIFEKDDVPCKPDGLIADDTSPGHIRLVQEAASRKSIFQGLHTHTLTGGGLKVFEELLPGFIDTCQQHGAHFPGITEKITDNTIRAYFGSGAAAPGTFTDPRCRYVLATRILIERCARHMLLKSYANIELRPCTKVASLVWDEQQAAVTGVRLSTGQQVDAALVIDTSGARSKAALEFLKERGIANVPSIRIDPGLSYYTRYFKMPQKALDMPVTERQRAIFHSIMPPSTCHQTVMEVENNMLQANLGLLNHQKCGKDLDDFIKFFKPPYAPSHRFYEMLQDAEPLTELIAWPGQPGTTRTFFEKVKMPDGYFVLGDAIASLNPRFATGMTISAQEAKLVGEVLAKKQPACGQPGMLSSSDLKGVSNAIQRQAAHNLDFTYDIVKDGDLVHSFTKGPRNDMLLQHVKQWYTEGIIDLMHTDVDIARTMVLVLTYLAPNSELRKPGFALKVIKHKLGLAWNGMGKPTQLVSAAVAMLAAAFLLRAVLLLVYSRSDSGRPSPTR